MKTAREEKASAEAVANQPKSSVSNDFKIALAAVCSSDDYKELEQKFFSGN